MRCVDGVWVVVRAGVQASDAMLVWVGRSVYSLCGAWGVEGGGMFGVIVWRDVGRQQV